MQFTLLTAMLLAGTSLALPSDLARSPGICKAPRCTAYCPDGFPYDCCVVYVRDPCSDHYGANLCTGTDDFECICTCPNKKTTYLCNAQYFIDPCRPLPAA